MDGGWLKRFGHTHTAYNSNIYSRFPTELMISVLNNKYASGTGSRPKLEFTTYRYVIQCQSSRKGRERAVCGTRNLDAFRTPPKVYEHQPTSRPGAFSVLICFRATGSCRCCVVLSLHTVTLLCGISLGFVAVADLRCVLTGFAAMDWTVGRHGAVRRWHVMLGHPSKKHIFRHTTPVFAKRYYYNNATGCSTWEDPCERWRYDIHVPGLRAIGCTIIDPEDFNIK